MNKKIVIFLMCFLPLAWSEAKQEVTVVRSVVRRQFQGVLKSSSALRRVFSKTRFYLVNGSQRFELELSPVQKAQVQGLIGQRILVEGYEAWVRRIVVKKIVPLQL